LTISPATVDYGHLDLPPGRYWLLSGNGGDVEIASCTTNAVTSQPPSAQ
jgi:hypothetical protein